MRDELKNTGDSNEPSVDPTSDPTDNDPLWNLLSITKDRNPVVPSPWFASRTVNRALAGPQEGSSPLGGLSSFWRWLVPIPLAAAAALLIFSLHTRASDKAADGIAAASEEKFLSDMELLASTL